jgi:hypothetical protein
VKRTNNNSVNNQNNGNSNQISSNPVAAPQTRIFDIDERNALESDGNIIL